MKKLTAVLTAAILSFTLSGCMLKSGDELLNLPKPPSDYLMLQKSIDAVAASGAMLISPKNGKNQAPIQLVDIDADGEPEALSFFKLSDSSGQFRVYVHKKDGNSYRELGYIEGHGDSIESINYPRSTSSGERAILVSWRLGSLELGMTICLCQNGHLKTVYDGEYSNLVIDDLDQNGTDEIITVMNDVKTSRFTAELHEFQGGAVKMLSETPLSKEAKKLDKIVTGSLADGRRAVFVDSDMPTKGLVTDIFAKKGNELVNLSLNDATGSGEKTIRKLPVYCSDVNSDNVLEVPQPELLPGYRNEDSADAQWSILWNRFSSDSSCKSLYRTYHNFSEEWYLVFRDGWAGNVTVTRESAAGMRYTSFGLYQKGKNLIPLLRIYAYTGDDRSTLANASGFVYLGANSSTAFAALIPPEASGESLALNEKDLKQLFHIIPEEWEPASY